MARCAKRRQARACRARGARFGFAASSAALAALLASRSAAFAAFFHAMLDHGVWLPPSAYEAWFVSAAHSDDDIERIASAARVAAVAAAAA